MAFTDCCFGVVIVIVDVLFAKRAKIQPYAVWGSVGVLVADFDHLGSSSCLCMTGRGAEDCPSANSVNHEFADERFDS